MLLQRQQRKIERRMQGDRREQRQHPARDPGEIAIVPVGAERSPCVIQGFPGTARIAANGARAIPSSEMLAAPSTKAIHTWAAGPGRSSAAITSHSNSNAGAMAATPMTVGRD